MYLKNPTSVITSILMLLVVLSLSGSRSVCWSSSTWRGTEGDGGIGGMPTHFATDDDDGKHGARRARPSWLQLTSSPATTYILTTKIDWRRKRFAPVLFAADFRFVPYLDYRLDGGK